jgi:hypothetical protein
MQLTARGLRIAPVAFRRLGLRCARATRLRNEPPAGVRWVHGGRQLMRKPLDRTERSLWFRKSLVAELEFGSRNPRAARRWSRSGVPVRWRRRRPLHRSRRCSQVDWHFRAGTGGSGRCRVAPPERTEAFRPAAIVVPWSAVSQPFRSAGVHGHREASLVRVAFKGEEGGVAPVARVRSRAPRALELGRPSHQSSCLVLLAKSGLTIGCS